MNKKMTLTEVRKTIDIMNKKMTFIEVRKIIDTKDNARTVANRMAELISGGCDYDEIAERLARIYADWCGMKTPNDGVYEIANNDLSNELKTPFSDFINDEQLIRIAKDTMKIGWTNIADDEHEFIVNSLTDQINMNCQGCDSSLEELEVVAGIMNINWSHITGEETGAWLKVVQDAAKEWLDENENEGKWLAELADKDIDSIDSRQRLNAIKNKLGCDTIPAYDKLYDAIVETIGTAEYEIAEELGENGAMVHIALFEIFGLVDEYTSEEIDDEVSDWEE